MFGLFASLFRQWEGFESLWQFVNVKVDLILVHGTFWKCAGWNVGTTEPGVAQADPLHKSFLGHGGNKHEAL